MLNNKTIVIYRTNRWLAEYLTFYLSRDFNIFCFCKCSQINERSLDPILIIADCNETELADLTVIFPHVPMFLILPGDAELDNLNISKYYQYPVDPDKLIIDIKKFAGLSVVGHQ